MCALSTTYLLSHLHLYICIHKCIVKTEAARTANKLHKIKGARGTPPHYN